MIAALFVDGLGIYAMLPGVDVWDEARDARGYAGPWPVVAHPPCDAWSVMGNCRPEIVRGEDGGCFQAALTAVRRWGGVLEHPAYSYAWKRFELTRPGEAGWRENLVDGGWVCQVDQFLYGHRIRKVTWLYYMGARRPAPLRWGTGPLGRYRVANYGGGKTRNMRARTPPAFRDALIRLAEQA